MAFNFGGQAGGQPNPAFGFSTPQTQSGFQFGTTNPTFGISAGTAQPATTASSAFAFGSGGNVSFGAPVFGAPAPNSTATNTFGGFGAPATGASSGFSFGAPAFGAGGTGTFGAPAAPAATTTAAPFFPSGGSFSFSNTGTPVSTSTPQFGTTVTAPAAAVQPFNFTTPTTSTPNIFGGTGFTLGGGAPVATAASVAPSLLPGGGATSFNFGGFGTGASTTAAPAPTFQVSSMPLLTPNTTTSVPAPVPFATTTLNLDGSQGMQAPTFAAPAPAPTPVAPISLPSLFSGGLGPSTASVAPTFKAPTTAIPAASSGFGILPSFSAASSAAATAATTSVPSLTFGTPASTKISLTGFTPTVTTTTTTTSSALSFGSLPASTTSVTPMSSVPVPSSGVSLSGVAAAAAAPTFSLGTSSLFTAPKTTAPTLASTISGPGTLSLSGSTAATSVAPATSGAPPAFTIGLPSALTSTSTSPTATTTATDTSVSVAAGTQMTFRQLEDAINKWNLELGDQERIFLNQATQVNAWDRLLIGNGLKIKDLHESVERVKLEQERLDHELDFIVSQQRELEELLLPLEKALDDTPALSIQQHADLQREHTYHLAEKVDCQLKRMAEDIKQIIEHLNTSQNQDETDPMQQVSKILNAHMDALQWVDQNTELLQKKLEEISKVMDSTKKDQETSWRISYN